jgi:hypothetical protein
MKSSPNKSKYHQPFAQIFGLTTIITVLYFIVGPDFTTKYLN